MKTRNRNKLRTIGALMIVCQVMLAVFVVRWLISQYATEKADLREKLNTVYFKVNDRILDSLFKKEMTVMMRAPAQHIEKEIVPLNQPEPIVHRAPQRFQIASQEGPVGIHFAEKHGADTISNVIIRGMRRFIVNIDGKSGNGRVVVDSIMLKKEFQKELSLDGLPLLVGWIKAKDSGNRMTIPKDMNFGNARLDVSNYKPIIFKKISPQIAFSTLLLALCMLAFLLSYTTVRRQIKLSAQKDSFISNMSHELKTPVATAKVAIEALSKFNALEDPVKTQDYLRMAGWEIDRLETLIANVLNNMQLEEGRIVMQQQEIDLAGMLSGIISSVRPLFTDRGKSIALAGVEQKISCLGDRIHLQGACYNIIDNALKYGGDKVNIELVQTRNEVRLIFSDNGSGVPKEFNHKIFEKFFRIPSGNIHNVNGYGLGLNYTKYVVTAHQGSIRQENNSEGGATFIITLPHAAAL